MVLPPLNFSYFIIEYKFLDHAVIYKNNIGNILRGAFGEVLRKLTCVEPESSCVTCRIDKECVYRKVFSPAPPENSASLRKISDIPRGFVIHYPHDDKTIYEKNDVFTFGLTLIGNIIAFLPYIILVLNEIGKTGIGSNRTKMELTGIMQSNPFSLEKHDLFSSKDNVIRPVDMFFNADSVKNDNNNTITVDFLTPTRLIREKKVLNTPDFATFIKRLRDRYFALNLFYSGAGGNNEFDHKLFGGLAERITTVSCSTRYIIQNRHARTQDYKLQDTSGFTGKAVFRGELEPFYKLMILGQYFGAGKGTTFGYGRYVIK